MPSLYALASLALALASASAQVLGSETDIAARALDLTDSIMAKHQLQKRRVNHADEYGYPHGLPKYHDGKKMTPGGYKDPRPQNFGHKCKRDNQCSSHVRLGAAQCQNGVCGFRCLGDTYKVGNHCVGKFRAPTCKQDSNCKTRVLNAKGACNDGKCVFRCNHGFHSEGNRCVRNSNRCGRRECAPVQGGWNECIRRGRRSYCQPQCASYLGFQLYTNADNSAYRCINTRNDPENCGSYGNTCQPGYNGAGEPICVRGQCTLNCRGYRRRRTLPNGQVYCSNV